MGAKWSGARGEDAVEQEGSDDEMEVDPEDKEVILIGDEGDEEDDARARPRAPASRGSPARGASSRSPGGSRSPERPAIVAAGKRKTAAPAADERRTSARAQARGGSARAARSISPGVSRSPREGGSAAGAKALAAPAKALAAGGAKRKAPVVQAAKVPVKEGETITIERCSFRAGKLLATGPSAAIFRGECTAGKHAGKKVAIKVQPRHKKTIYQITTENHALTMLSRTSAKHLQQHLAYGSHKDECYVLVTELLSRNLLETLPASGGLSARTTLLLAHQSLEVLQGVHANGFVHRDIKPENLVLGFGAAEHQVHLIDFGTAESLTDRNGARRTGAQRVEGTLPYMATTVHQKQPLSMRDDLESLAWTLLKLHLGTLPWEGLDMKKEKEVVKHKEACKKAAGAAGDMPPFMCDFFDGFLKAVGKLRTESEPDYAGLQKLVREAWKSGTPSKDFGAFPAAGKAKLSF